MAAQTTDNRDKDIFHRLFDNMCGAYHHLLGQKGHKKLNYLDPMNQSFGGQTLKCEEPHNNLSK